MPEELCVVTDLEKALDYSDDYIFNIHNYQSIQNALDADDNIRVPVVEKLLSFCVRQLKADMKYTSNILNIISTVLEKIKNVRFSPLPDLVPSAVGVLNTLKTTALFNKIETLKTVCFEIILSYPDETLISLVVNQSNELKELINLYCHQRIPLKIRLQILSVLCKLLKILPPEKRAIFVKENIDVWFSRIIPFITITSALPQVLDVLELLTQDLVNFEYGDNSNWRVVLEHIYTPQKYPTFMKNLLESQDDNWYRLWIIFIKLLKSQITKSMSNTGSPINSMLPVVEMAFKMDVQNRCKAFLCWNVLIDNFSMETNETYINKRIKLLVIPLTSNNAKVEETALAKLNTWWHLICNFYLHMDKISNVVLMPFMYFCFGKSVSDKPMFVPGTISETTKAQCVQVFINICGHVNCQGCVDLPKLKGKLLTPKMLVDHWREWIHFLSSALKSCAENDNFTNEQIECLWKSFIKTIRELPDNNIRRDLFMEVLGVLNKMTTDCNPRMYYIILNILIYSLIDDVELHPLMVTKDDKFCPILFMVKVVLKLPSNSLENSQIVNNLKPIANFLIKEAINTSSHTIECILKDLSSNNILFWVALADTCANYYSPCERMLCKMILCPLKHLEQFAKEDVATIAWVKLYEFAYNKLQNTKINENVFTILMSHTGSLKSYKFIIHASIAAAKNKIDCIDDNFENEAEWLLKSVNNINGHVDIEDMIPVLSVVVVDMMKKLCVNKNSNIAEQVILITEQLLKLLKPCITKNAVEDSYTHLQSILENLKLYIKIPEYSKLVKFLLNQFKSYAVVANNNESLRNLMLDVISTANKDASVEEVIKLLKENSEQNSEVQKPTDGTKFTTPGAKGSAKKSKKKETNIVNTVIENGEEYVVVKSNWKFNPRKLTDNQKEKFQRKREDIPALYQDLSQSQDDFKLNTWKTDSQDTTTTSKSTSVPAGSEDVSIILKNIPHSEFVPKILENIIGKEKADCKETASKENTNTEIITDHKNDANKLQIVKESKSPRVALKDRVFKNVKSLMEKSNVNNENSVASCKVLENLPKTPTTKPAPSSHVTNSAPTLISADRPSRLKRKPKKFEDLQFCGLKRRRHSLGQNDSPTDGESSDSNSVEPNTESLGTKKNFAGSETKQIDITNKEKEDTANVIVPDSNETCLDASAEEEKNVMKPVEMSKNKDQIDEGDDSEPTSTVADALNSNEAQIDKPTATNQKPAEELITKPSDKNDKNLFTPKADKNKLADPKSSTKKASVKKSRIEKELAIDMVEGHPFLNTPQSQKRLTRKAISNSPCTRKNVIDKLNKNKVASIKTEKKNNDKDKSISIKETQNSTADILESQDVIESSQESSVTPISVKSNKTSKKVPVVSLEDINEKIQNTQNFIDEVITDVTMDSKDDVELPSNRTVEEKLLIDLTENMDTEPMNSKFDVIIINDEDDQLLNDDQDEINKSLSVDIQNTAEADTQTLDSQIFAKENKSEDIEITDVTTNILTKEDTSNVTTNTIADDVTQTMTESILEKDSPFKDEEQRKMDFMNNTLEISPIKTLCPLQERKSPPENNDYMVIKLSSPVQGNGEPFDKCESPEIFTEEKSPPREQSPTRQETTAVNTSPSSSLSLKKNRPQVRSNGRAAQMLGLCVPDIRMDDEKKGPSVNTSARRNLRILYNASGEQSDTVEESEDSDNFLKFKKLLPSTDCSPSGPILKRKLADIADEATASPASKRKRVSFHDPPVSTTICVKKYIEPCAVRSPQNSAIKRQERLLRSQLPMKSPKRLENVFKLDSILTKTIESFSETTTSDTEISPLETTPEAEIVKTSEFNDIEPICPELVECKDSISHIASDLSSPTMKVLLDKEFEGKIESIGDLAKLTNLEINRLCIKTPKVQTARKVLDEYSNKTKAQETDVKETIVKEMETSVNKSVEIQTNIFVENMGIQTEELLIQSNTTQTEIPLAVNCSVQTDDAGRSSTADIVTTCLSERADFLEKLCDKMDEDSKRKIADNLSFNDLTNTLISKLTPSNCTQILNRVIEEQSKNNATDESNNDRKLCFIKDYLCDNFEPKHLVLFCSDLLKNVYNKS